VYKNYTADYKFFQEHQQKSRRFPVFPGGISNSRRFPVFPGVVDTLLVYGILIIFLRNHIIIIIIIRFVKRQNVKRLPWR